MFTEPLTVANDVGDAYIMLDKADNDKRRRLRRRRRRLRRHGDFEYRSAAPLYFRMYESHAHCRRSPHRDASENAAGPIKMSRGNESAGRDQP